MYKLFMNKRLTDYFYHAEDGYQYFKAGMKCKIISGDMAANAQNICERYLKFVIESLHEMGKITNLNVKIMHSYNLRTLINYIEEVGVEVLDRDIIVLANSYYFSSRYPSDNTVIVREKDLIGCDKVVESSREFAKKIKDYKDNWLKENEKKDLCDRELKENNDIKMKHMSLFNGLDFSD